MIQFFKILLVPLCLASCITATAVDEGQPNIIIIYADDVGYGDLGCYGATGIDTPSLDRLAQAGMRFTAAYATASTCTPSRYSLLTGEYAFRNRDAKILPGNSPLIIDPSKPTIASLLKQGGYATGLVGKWHLGLGLATEPLDWNGDIKPGPRELGFDYSFHMAATGDRVPTVYIENGRIVDLDPADPVQVSYEGPVGDDPTGLSHPHLLKNQADEQHAKTIVDGTSRIGYMTGGQAARWTDEEMPDTFLGKALGFIEANKDQPFFLYYATHENHVPRIPHPRFRGSSSLGVRGDAVVQMDWGIGRLMETLDELGLTDNTLVIFSSDNGPVLFDGYYDGAYELNGDHKPAGPWAGGKYSAWEGGTRLPLIVSWPNGVEPGISDALLSQVDLLASLAALTGVEVPEGHAGDSHNMLDALTGKSATGRDHLIQQGVQMLSIRKGPWKYFPPGEVTDRARIDKFVKHPVTGPGALFYLPEDPVEQNNLAHLYPAKVNELRDLLNRESGNGSTNKSTGDELGGAPQSLFP
jgi:arylsulfatase A-like enzyme